MCKSIDAAVSMINKSIDLVNQTGDNRYYMDNVKLHKLLYLAQCLTYCKGKELFNENIEAHNCGPIVRGIDLIMGKCGFDLITNKLDPSEFGTADMPLSPSRAKSIDEVLARYGTFSTDDIVDLVKHSLSYDKYLNNACHSIISIKDLTDAGKEFFS